MKNKEITVLDQAIHINKDDYFSLTDTTKEEIEKLIVNTNVLCRYSILSSIVANPLSGWY